MSILSDSWIGPVAGVATSGLWVTTSIFFTAASQRLGATVVNSARLVLAVCFLALTYWWISGEWWPAVQGMQLLTLAISGVVGLAICDQCLFKAFVEIGPRRTQLIMTTSPLFAVLLGLFFLGERLSAWGVIGVMITLAGVAWVVTERGIATGTSFATSPASLRRGLLLATVGAASQAVGAWLSKEGMGEGVLVDRQLGPQPATLVRVVFGTFAMVPIFAYWWWRHGRHRSWRESRWASGMGWTTLGTIGGPYLGVWCSLIAFQYSPIGVAQTLCSLSPVMILPLMRPVYGERVSSRAVFGALVAVAGSSLLFVA